MTRIAYVLPAPLDRTPDGAAEVARRASVLRGWASVGTEVVVLCADSGPATVESAYEEYLTVPATARIIRRLDADGYDAAIVGCFGDPGLDALRELSSTPVVGPAQCSAAVAATLGTRFSVLTIGRGVVGLIRRAVHEAGIGHAFASVRHIDTTVAGVLSDEDETTSRLAEAGADAIERDGADVLVLGCMSMGFADRGRELSAKLGVPVVNPVHASLKHAESLVAQGLTHSRLAYPVPGRLAAGVPFDDLFVEGPR